MPVLLHGSNTAGLGRTISFIRDPEDTLISMRNSAGASFYYTADALGSTILLTDSAQAKAATYLYDSWGNTTTQTGTQASVNPWRYAAGYKDDATGFTKFGARYYAPGIGRFSQPDPSWQEANRYLYAGASPCNFTDPRGLDAVDECVQRRITEGFFEGALAGAVIGGVRQAESAIVTGNIICRIPILAGLPL